MQVMSHDYRRLHYRGMRGFERPTRAERRYQVAVGLLALAAFLVALYYCGGTP